MLTYPVHSTLHPFFFCIPNLNSIIPCLALRGMASAIALSKSLKAKILLRK